MDKLRLIFVILTLSYSLVWIVAYRFIKVDRPVRMKYHPTPIETTTAEERARGECSFELARGQQIGVTGAAFVVLVIIGYAALAAAFALALMVRAHQSHDAGP